MVELIRHEVLEALHHGPRHSTYLGRTRSTGALCILKVARRGVHGPREIAMLKREHEITSKLDVDGIVKVLDLEVRGDQAALVMEHFEGRSLRAMLDESGYDAGPAAAIKITLQLAETLGALHDRNVIHNDITPGNILVDPGLRMSRLTAFSLASLLPAERAAVYDPWSSGGGTLQYMSPEQTGRMNRSIDFRSDYYALGVTLYELTTGRLPFETTDPMELVHSHIAKTPVPPHQVRSSVPEALSGVIMKLLSKTAEARYQSAFGLRADLQACLDLLEGGGPASGFVVGQKDRPTRLQVSQRLYGRQEEVAALMSAFKDTSGPRPGDGGSSELLLVAGYAGVGKSSIVSEIHKPIAEAGGYFAAGKFDQLSRNIPYASIIAALRELVRQLLTESKEELDGWKTRILAAVSPNGQVIADVIPEIALIIGKQPPVPALGPIETRNRFNLTFRGFIGAITSPGRALVLFLDDLQWADTGSLNLIRVLMEDPDIRHLLLIGAYRDSEVDDAHPLMMMLSELRQSQARVRTLALRPLEREHVEQLVSDTLGSPRDECRPLSNIIFSRTEGNPLFVIQHMTTIHREGHLCFDAARGAWRWSAADIARTSAAENVVDLMLLRVRGLEGATQRVLTLAACIGNRFDLKLLSRIHQGDLRATDEDLWPALEAGLILPVDSDYKIARFLDEDDDGGSVEFKFLHDRVQQAAYKLLRESERKRIHLELGRQMLRETPPASLEERIHEIVTHLNLGAELIVDRQQRYEVAALNLKAGQKARRGAAYGPGAQCLRAAAALLPDDAWGADYALSLAIYTDLVELEYLTTNFECAERYTKVVEDRASSVLDKIRVYETRIQFYISQNRMQDAIDVALGVLAMLDVPLSATPPANLDIARLRHLPPITDGRMYAAVKILASIIPAVYLANPHLLPPIAFTMVDICTRHGNSPTAAFAYSIYGIIQCGVMGNVDEGFEFGRLALDLVQQFGAVELESKIYASVYVFIHHWKRHLRETIDPLLHATQMGLQTGDVSYASYSTTSCSTYSLFAGEDLTTTESRMRQSAEVSIKLNQQYSIYYIKIWKQLVIALRDASADKTRLVGDSFDETTMLPFLGQSRTSMFMLHLAKGMLLYYFGDPEQACESLRAGEEYQDAVVGMVTALEHNFYQSLSMLAALDRLPEAERDTSLSRVDANQQRLEAWARFAPENNRHKHDLVGAELARVKRDVIEAMEFYDRAIEGARTHGFLHEEALAYELASSFYRGLGRQEIARQYMTNAFRAYALWGADAKTQALVASYPWLAEERVAPAERSRASVSHPLDPQLLDVAAIIRSAQAVASEIVLPKVIDRLLRIAVANAGAQRGALLLLRDQRMFLEATLNVEPETVEVDLRQPAEARDDLPQTVLNYVTRTGEVVVIRDAPRDARFGRDPAIVRLKPRSILCLPLQYRGGITGLLYLEHRSMPDVFQPARVEVLGWLSAQAAIAVENADLLRAVESANAKITSANERLEQTVAERTRELREAQARLIALEKEATEVQMAGGFAHEMRNILTGAKTFLERVCGAGAGVRQTSVCVENSVLLREVYLATKDQLPTETRAATATVFRRINANEELLETTLRDIGEALDRGLASTRMILEYAKVGRERPGSQMVRVRALIESILNEMSDDLVRHAIDVDVLVDSGAELRGNEIHLYSILRNLLLNARDAVCEAGDRRQKHIVVSLAEEPDGWVLQVDDTGVGIPPELHARIFDPFFSTKPESGTGLGLGVVKKLAALYEGAVELSSQPDHGTSFRIVIPRVRSGAGLAPPSLASAAGGGTAVEPPSH
ncbi:trifunctional serine/threonine-protein kinase/ATP-binding protein/sensor histidine kinase [Sorangium sp. So ce1099]|uniref:trifunctional serine/threonine-protein kinase/ATP-binding protein/sensor histidine kinase n=1 Tax=Sorangium sp. So ce1099 TaxID=3133331 RepID=UPI003F60A360